MKINSTTTHAGSLVGRRVRLALCTIAGAELRPGDEGTVRDVDVLGVHVEFDSGVRLPLVYEAGDRWTVLS